MADWYVSQDGAGNEDGTTSNDPWAYADIVWGEGGVDAGDTLHLLASAFTALFDVQASGTSGSAITIQFEEGAYIDGTNATSHGLRIDGQDYIDVEDCDIRNAGNAGSSECGGIALLGGASNININGGTITDTGDAASSGYGIFIRLSTADDFDSIVIDGVTIDGASGYGINIAYRGSTGALSNCTIQNCTINDIRRDTSSEMGIGINIRYTDASEVDSGRNTTALLIQDNVISNTAQAAIRPMGVKGTGNDQSYLRRNRCTTIGAADSTTNAIQLSAADNIIVEDNTIDGVFGTGEGDGAGIIVDWVGDSDPYRTDGAIIRNNLIMNCRAGGQGKGISIWQATDAQVYGNTIISCSIGIRLSNSTSTGAVIDHNTMIACDLPVEMQSSAPASTLRGNVLISFGDYCLKTSGGSTVNPTKSGNVYVGQRLLAFSDHGSEGTLESDATVSLDNFYYCSACSGFASASWLS